MNKMTLRDIDVKDKTALVRVDFNVPLEKGEVADDARIRGALPTITYLQSQQAKVVLCSHLGRPDGKVAEALRLTPVAGRLQELLEQPVATASDCVGPTAEAAVAGLEPGGVLLLENLRFHPEEEKNDPEFARQLAALADVYVNDAFGTAHRAHASTEGVAKLLPAVAGLLMEKEIDFLGQVFEEPKRPFVAVLGGAKVTDKIFVIEALLTVVDRLIIGGGMANAFLAAQGIAIGASKLGERDAAYAHKILEDATESGGVRVEVPHDVVVAEKFEEATEHKVVKLGEIPSGWMILDIGPETGARYAEAVKGAKTVLWNGPMGVFEWEAFAGGTKVVARALGESGAMTIVGGGETAQAVEEVGVADKITHVSTGGGATLEFLEGKILPGVAALRDK